MYLTVLPKILRLKIIAKGCSSLLWRLMGDFFHLLPKPLTCFYVCLKDGAARNRESNRHQFSCTSLWDLNSGRFTDWATAAKALMQIQSDTAANQGRILNKGLRKKTYILSFQVHFSGLLRVFLQPRVLMPELRTFTTNARNRMKPPR